jgi:DNA-binding phage protein
VCQIRVPQPAAYVDIAAALVHHVHMSIPTAVASAGSNPTTPEVPISTYLAKRLYDVRSGRFDPVLLRLELLEREMTPGQLAQEADIARSSVYKALRGHGVRYGIAMAILGALARHPRSLPSLD